MSKSFDDFVNQQAKAAKEVPIDKEKELARWLGALKDFYTKIEGFIEPYLRDGSIKKEYKKLTLNEEFSGPYQVDALTLSIGPKRVQFKPIGTMLIGAKGRIDMTGPRGSVRFVLVDKDSSAPKISVRVWIQGQQPPPAEPIEKAPEWIWKISTPPPKIKYTELEQESFQTALMEVANA